jgi:hypothetical protein
VERVRAKLTQVREDLDAWEIRSGCEFDFAVVVAVAVVRVVQVAAHQVICVIAVRNSLVTAVRAVNMALLVSAAIVLRSALVRIGAARTDLVIINVIAMNIVHMAIMKVIGVAVVAHRGMSALWTVRVGMPFVLGAGSRHNSLLG